MGNTSVKEKFLRFGAPLIEEPEIAEVVNCMRSGWLGTGSKAAKFEDMFRQYVGARHVVALNSCSAALHLSLLASGIGPGDEVITSPMTFCATPNAIVHAGATPVFVDCERDTQLIDPQRVEDAITSKTRATIPVHLYGRPCNMEAIGDIARRHDLLVVEDAAHAIEGVYKGRKIGTISRLTCFSFYVNKNMTTGEGGMLTTDDAELAKTIRMYASHGLSQDAWTRYSGEPTGHYQVVVPGFKYNMMDLQAAIGIHQLERLEMWLKKREEIWKHYDHAFSELPVGLPADIEPETVHARHLYTLMIDKNVCGIDRDEFRKRLHELQVGSGIHYIAVHLHPFYRDRFGLEPGDFPNATWISERTVSIPLSARLTPEDIDHVVDAVRCAVAG